MVALWQCLIGYNTDLSLGRENWSYSEEGVFDNWIDLESLHLSSQGFQELKFLQLEIIFMPIGLFRTLSQVFPHPTIKTIKIG